MRYNGADYYYHTNHQGSVTELLNQSGGIVKTYRYDAFGKILTETGPAIPGGFTYTGRELHSRSGLYYYRFRWYDSQTGRFITQDPILWGGGINLYGYVENNPVNWMDPYGLEIVVEGDLQAYQQAIGYLNRDPGMSAIIRNLTLSSTTYTVVISNSLNDNYYNDTHKVTWAPNYAVITVCGGRLSPALGLGHELAHAEGYSEKLSRKKCPQYGDLEEKRVITGPEAAAARTLDESVRTDHLGAYYWVPTPTARFR